MASEDKKTWASSLRAGVEERFAAPLRRNAFASRAWFYVALAAVIVLHAAVLAYVLHRDSQEPPQTAQAEETPVEVIVEKPPPPPPPPAKPEQQAKPEFEKPATSAPRAPNEDKVETRETQKDTHAPKASRPPTDGKPEPSREASSPTDDPAKPDPVEDSAKQEDVQDKDAEALDKAVPEPPKKTTSLIAKAKPPARIHKDETALDQLAGDSDLPDYSFRRPTKKSPVYGGNEDSRYLSIVFGMIMANRRPRSDASGNVTISFNVDDGGNVVDTTVLRPSGDDEIDREAMAAIRRASPFPPPPAGAPHGLIATIAFGDDEPLATGRRVGQ